MDREKIFLLVIGLMMLLLASCGLGFLLWTLSKIPNVHISAEDMEKHYDEY